MVWLLGEHGRAVEVYRNLRKSTARTVVCCSMRHSLVKFNRSRPVRCMNYH